VQSHFEAQGGGLNRLESHFIILVHDLGTRQVPAVGSSSYQ
jgi:hypothetical protein